MDVKWEGMKELQKALQEKAKMSGAKTLVKFHGAQLQNKAQNRAPVGTPESTGIPGYKGGTLRRSIGLELTDNGFTAEVEAKANYAGYVEYGTRYMNARPFLRTSYAEVSQAFKKDLERLAK